MSIFYFQKKDFDKKNFLMAEKKTKNFYKYL